MENMELTLKGKYINYQLLLNWEWKSNWYIKIEGWNRYITLPEYRFGNEFNYFLDGEKDIKGNTNRRISRKATFIETVYLLIYGNSPQKYYQDMLNEHSMIHEDMHHFCWYTTGAHPMAILSSMVNSLSILSSFANRKANQESWG